MAGRGAARREVSCGEPGQGDAVCVMGNVPALPDSARSFIFQQHAVQRAVHPQYGGGESRFTQNFPFLPVPAGSSAMERAGLMIHNSASVQSIVSPASFFTGRRRYRSNPVKGKRSPHPCETLHGVQHAGRKRNFDSVSVQYCSRDRHG